MEGYPIVPMPADGTGSVTINLSAASANGALGTDSITGFLNVIGSSSDDLIIGNSGSNSIIGGDGDDILDGGAGIVTGKQIGRAHV